MAARLRDDGCVDRLRELLRKGATKEVGEDRGAESRQLVDIVCAEENSIC